MEPFIIENIRHHIREFSTAYEVDERVPPKPGRFGIRYPTYDSIVKVNMMLVSSTGEPFGVLQPQALKYIVSVVHDVGEGPRVESKKIALVKKGAFYLREIISRHIFAEANHRTGLKVMHTFLRANGHRILPVSDDEIERVVFGISVKQMPLVDVEKWVERVLINA